MSENINTLTKKALSGDKEAQFELGWYYYDLGEYDVSDKEAVKWFQKAADQNHAEATFYLATCYDAAIGIREDHKKAYELYKRAAELGFADAYFTVACAYDNGEEALKQDRNEAFKWFKKAAENEVTDAYFYLGHYYENGYGVKKDYEQAAKWYQKGIDNDDGFCFDAMAELYKNGWGVKQNFAKTIKLLNTAAEEFDIKESQFKLGLFAFEGSLLPKDYKVAYKYFAQAAERKYPPALYYKGVCLLNGYGVKKNKRLAIIELEKAADRGYAQAEKLLDELE